jgi:hypothetical protein
MYKLPPTDFMRKVMADPENAEKLRQVSQSGNMGDAVFIIDGKRYVLSTMPPAKAKR